MNDPNLFKLKLKENLICSESSVPGSWIWWPNGQAIRSAIFDGLRDIVTKFGYAEITLPNLVRSAAVQRIDTMEHVSSYYREYSEGTYIAASHEGTYYSEIFNDPNFGGDGNLRHFFISPAFRKPKRTLSAFRIGERSSFFQCYGGFSEVKGAETEMEALADQLYRYTFDSLKIPCVLVDRPKSGNKNLSDRCIAVEMITPFRRTLTGPMLYLHGDKYSDIFDLKKKKSIRQFIHFGATDYLIINFIYSNLEKHNLENLGYFSPLHVRISREIAADFDILSRRLRAEGFNRVALSVDVARDSATGIPTVKSPTMCSLEKLSTGNGIDLACYWQSGGTTLNASGEAAENLVRIALDFVNSKNQERRDKALSEAVVHVNTMEDVSAVVKAGLIASFFLSTSPDTISGFCSSIEAGELLGRDRNSFKQGDCIISGADDGVIHFAARRV